MIERIEIIPFIGASPYYLGKSFEEIKEKLNLDIQIIKTKTGKRIIDGIVSLRFVDNVLNEFSILEEKDKVFFENFDVFEVTFVENLKIKYKSIYKYGFIEKEEQKTITVYQKGSWDKILSRC